jgi:hypothetical protein
MGVEGAKKKWFFYSKRQMNARRRGAFLSGSFFKRLFCILEDGRMTEYTECNDKDVPKGRYRDYEHLGEGRHCHCFPERGLPEDLEVKVRAKMRQKKTKKKKGGGR